MLGVQAAEGAVEGRTAARGDDTSPSSHASGSRWGLAHVPALDGLRGAAVIAVLLYHAGYLDGGYLGVDLFFVLSGYLITSLLLAEHTATGAINLPGFWARRARRLLPALLVLLVVVAAYAVGIARAVDLGSIRRDGLATLLYVANWNTILGGDSYWDISRAPSPLQHTWSLAIEEQFYLLWPLVVVLVARLARDRVSYALRTICFGFAAVSAALFVGLGFVASETRVYEGTDTRAAALLLGAGWAAWQFQLRAGGQAVPWGRGIDKLAVAAAAGLGVAWIWLEGESDLLFRGGLPLCSLGALVLIVGVTARPESASTPLARALSWGPLRGIGLISYGLYLYHWPIYRVVKEGRFDLHGFPLLVARLALSLLAAWLSYVLVEMPVRRGALRGSMARGGLVAGMAAAAVAIVVATVGAVSPATERVVATEVVPGAPKVMFVGDSVGLSLANHVASDPWRFQVNPSNRTWIACTLMADFDMRTTNSYEVEPVGCTQYFSTWIEQDQPELVVMMFGAGPVFEVDVGGRWVEACDPVFDEEYARVHQQRIEQFGSTGAQVVVVTTPFRSRDTYPFDDPEANARAHCANDALARAVTGIPYAHLLDLNQLVCPGGACVGELDGEPIRSDGLHFDDGPGGASVAEWIVGQSLSLTGGGQSG